jgi:glycine cleavage system H protein
MSSQIPNNLRYTSEHEWIKIVNNLAIVGITDFAQNSLGDIVFVDLPEEGKIVSKDSTFGTVESIKSVSDLYAPLSGTVVAVNSQLVTTPELVNKTPYDSWMIKIEFTDESELSDLLSPENYQSILEQH